MAGFTIKAEYETGDSAGHHPATQNLNIVWATAEAAKAALKRLTEHYRWHEVEYGGRDWKYTFDKKPLPEEPEWHKGLDVHQVKVALDNGNEVQFWPPWCGHFETLHSLEIVAVADEENDWKVTF